MAFKQYTLSFADSIRHVPQDPDRTAKRNMAGGLNFDVIYQVWPNRLSMARTIRMQQKRASKSTDWHACVKLTDTEGY